MGTDLRIPTLFRHYTLRHHLDVGRCLHQFLFHRRSRLFYCRSTRCASSHAQRDSECTRFTRCSHCPLVGRWHFRYRIIGGTCCTSPLLHTTNHVFSTPPFAPTFHRAFYPRMGIHHARVCTTTIRGGFFLPLGRSIWTDRSCMGHILYPMDWYVAHPNRYTHHLLYRS